MNPSLDESSVDASIDRPIEESNATSTISRQINDPSIDQASDRFINQSINRRIDPSINLSSDHFRIHRIGRTRERKYKGERSERARQRFRKRKIKKKIYTPRRARAAGACLPLYCKYSAPRARLVYLLWTKGNCYSMPSRIRKRSFGKFLT